MDAPYLEAHQNDQPHASPVQNFFAFCPTPKTYTNTSNQVHFPRHLSSISTEEEGRDQCRPSVVVDDKRLRRMISNRESARRSRMRKKQQMEELQSDVDQLQAMNRQLWEKLITLLESNHEILQENAQLKEKVSTLQMVLADVLRPTSLERKSANIQHIINYT